MWPRTVSMGMVLGDFYNGTLLAKFSFAWSIHCIRGDPYKAVRKARRQMIWRLMLVGSLVVLGLKIPGVEAISMFVGVALIQPALYVVYWWLSRHF